MVMIMKRSLRRTIWPAILTVVGIATYFAHAWIRDALHLDAESDAVRVLTGAFAYFAAAWLGGRLVGIALERATTRRRRVPRLLQDLISAAFFLAALIATVMLVMGQSTAGALAGSGLVLAVLGFAIRNVVADVLSGIALGVEGPYRIGDWVDIDGVIRGRIVEIGWRTTRLLTRDATYMILPNSQIARQKLTNYSAPQRHYRAQLQVMLSHDVAAARGKSVLLEALKSSPRILTDPQPDVRIKSYDPGGIVYAVRYWVSRFDEDVDCRDCVLEAIDAALREHGIAPPHTRIRLSEPDQNLELAATTQAVDGERRATVPGPAE